MSRAKKLTKFRLVHGAENGQSWVPVNVADPEHLKLMSEQDNYDYNKHLKDIGKDENGVFIPYDEPLDDFKDEELENPDIQELIQAMEDDAFVFNEDIDQVDLECDDEDIFKELRASRPIDDDFDMFMDTYDKVDEEEEELHSRIRFKQELLESQKEFMANNYNKDELKDKILGYIDVQNQEYDDYSSSASSSEFDEVVQEYNCDTNQLESSSRDIRPSVIELPRNNTPSKIIELDSESSNEDIVAFMPIRKKGETKEEKKLRKEQQKMYNQLRRTRKKTK